MQKDKGILYETYKASNSSTTTSSCSTPIVNGEIGSRNPIAAAANRIVCELNWTSLLLSYCVCGSLMKMEDAEDNERQVGGISLM